MNSKPQPQQKKIDLTHYTRLLNEKKIWIIVILILFSAAWFMVIPKLLKASKKYTFTATIRFDDPSVRSGVGNFDERATELETESRTKIVTTTPFLTDVIDSLKLNILSGTPGVSREEIFAKIELGEKPHYGSYLLQREKRTLELRYTNKKEGKEKFLLDTQPLVRDSLVYFDENGIQVAMEANIFKDHKKITFDCIPTRVLVQGLREKLDLRLNRRQTLFGISYEFNDPFLGPKIVNTIAGLFLEKSLQSKRFRTRTLMHSLTEQLQSSKVELEKADNALRRYRERNPHIYLTGDLASYNQQMTSESLERDQIGKNLSRLSGLLDEVKTVNNSEDRDLVYQEVLSFLQEQRIPGITALTQQYQNSLAQKQSLTAQNYAADNPRMVEVNSALNSLQKKIGERAAEFKREQEARNSQLEQNMHVAEGRMRQSPRKEIELARLQRNREAKAQIYSNLLVRYSEVKVADVSITPDGELLQRAEIPVIVPDIKKKLKKLMIYLFGPLLGVLLGGGLFVGLDFLHHRARSEKDMEQILEIPVLATIPMIGAEKETVESFDKGRRLDPRLVTIDFVPTPASEAFRNLRTRLVLDKNPDQHLVYVLTSLLPNEGKSLVVANMAITFAQMKKSTLLIDGDIRRGVQHNTFAVEKKPGLSDILAGRHSLDGEKITEAIHKTTIPNLHLLPAGKEIPNPTELIMNPRMEDILVQLKKRFNYILIDTPPINLIPDAFVFNKFLHAMILVTRYGKTDVKKLHKEIAQYEEMKENIRGVVLNGARVDKKKGTYGYSYYKY